ncbi:hypothetical protein OH799_32175 [Nocardia sp. NBC_00881]|uniref:hypothetical protein n=1 Tax=Nocardia sp. NBC_00881 TaxID=2975995 RepID=UPI0038690F2F|nr:hypothetical protein OH799_32175 [Nocardia sp. NBC_00881]
MHRIAGWWDGFELWVAGLPFIPQFLVVLVGMVPISFAIAYGLDRLLRSVLRMLDRRNATLAAPPAIRSGSSAEEPELVVTAENRQPVQSGAR